MEYASEDLCRDVALHDTVIVTLTCAESRELQFMYLDKLYRFRPTAEGGGGQRVAGRIGPQGEWLGGCHDIVALYPSAPSAFNPHDISRFSRRYYVCSFVCQRT